MCVRTEHGVRLIEVPTVVPSTTRATFCGLTSVREILGRSARVAPASPIPTTENRYAATTFLRPPLVPFGFTSFSPKRAEVATGKRPDATTILRPETRRGNFAFGSSAGKLNRNVRLTP